jgi:hypothetical protein
MSVMRCTVDNCNEYAILFKIGFHRKDRMPFVTNTHYCKKHKDWALKNIFTDKKNIIEFDKPHYFKETVLDKWLWIENSKGEKGEIRCLKKT